MKRIRVSGSVFFPCLLLIAGCSEAPQSEVTEALQALELAKSSEAQTYAADRFEETNQLIGDAEAEIAAQNERFFAVRNYDRAKEILDRAKSAAAEARTLAIENRETARQEAEQALAEARQALEVALATVDGAPRGKGTALDLQALHTDLSSAQHLLGEIETNLYRGGRYIDAARSFREVKQKAQMVTSEVEMAIAKRRRS